LSFNYNLRFEIYVNDFKITTHYNPREESGLIWCKKYMSEFQVKVINCEMKLLIYTKDHKTTRRDVDPYDLSKTLFKKPRKKKE
jgi:hypothetical protein